jgi:SAM-dependent methyltransferase
VERSVILQVDDPSAGPTGFTLVMCGGCALVSLEPQPGEEALAACYPPDYWQPLARERKAPRPIERAQQLFIERRLAAGLRPLTRRLRPGARVLDVGCGSGALLHVLGRAGYHASGVEMSATAAAEAAAAGARVHVGSLESAACADASFDAVTMIHVLEHLRDPVRALGEVRRVLRPGGWLLVEVPNIQSIAYALFGRRWQPLALPQHLFHFAPASLSRAVRVAGFGVERVSQYSARVSAAAWARSVAPTLDPVQFRRRDAAGRSALTRKLAYLALQLLLTPPAVGSAWMGRGDVVRMLARKPA